jgi:phospholipase/carboxylesterase
MHITRRAFLGVAGTVLGMASVPHPSAAAEVVTGVNPLNLDRVRDGILYVPTGYQAAAPTPLVVVFHGAGSSGLNCQYAFASADEFGYLLLAPDSRSELTWDLVLGEYGPDIEFLETAVTQTLGRCNVDRRALSVAGHSDGASYALSFGITSGDVFGHILAFSPGVMTPVAARGKPKVFISHGTDDQVMPIDATSRKFVPRLRGLGYDVTYREYEGRHAVPAPIVHEGFTWLHRGG